MGAAARLRVQHVAEDAADGCALFAVCPSGDVLDDAVAFEETWPDWHCDSCGHPNIGPEWACCYCGNVREDVDP